MPKRGGSKKGKVEEVDADVERAIAGAPRVGCAFWFRDGFMFMATGKEGAPLVKATFRPTSSRRDEWGVPEHEHGWTDQPANQGRPWHDLLDDLATGHGGLYGTVPVYYRYLISEENRVVHAVTLLPMLLPEAPGGPAAALTLRHAKVVVVRHEVPDGVAFVRAAEIGGEAAGAGVLHAEHEHWLPSADPLPLDAAWWIFRTLRPDQIKRVPCNCPPKAEEAEEVEAELVDEDSDSDIYEDLAQFNAAAGTPLPVSLEDLLKAGFAQDLARTLLKDAGGDVARAYARLEGAVGVVRTAIANEGLEQPRAKPPRPRRGRAPKRR